MAKRKSVAMKSRSVMKKKPGARAVNKTAGKKIIMKKAKSSVTMKPRY